MRKKGYSVRFGNGSGHPVSLCRTASSGGVIADHVVCMSELLAAVGAFLGIALILDLIARATPAAVAQMPKIRAARMKFLETQERGRRGLTEVARLKSSRDQFTDEIMLLEARLRDTRRRAAAFAAGRTILVHEMGRTGPEQKLFEAYVVNPLVANPNKPVNMERINPVYCEPQLIECWADNLAEAKQIIGRVYTKEHGFDVEMTSQTIDAVVHKPS